MDMRKIFGLLCPIVFGMMLSVAAFAQTDLKFEYLTQEDGLSQVSIHCLLRDRNGWLWAGSQDGLNRYNGYQVTVYRSDADNPNSLVSSDIHCLAEGQGGILWIGTQNGLSRFNTMTHRFQRFVHTPGNLNCLTNNDIKSVLVDHTGLIWIGTSEGLNVLDERTGKIKRYLYQARGSKEYTYDPRQPQGINDKSIRCLLEDKKGDLWVGTAHGLNYFDRKSDRFIEYHQQPTHLADLSDNTINCLAEDIQGNLWIGGMKEGGVTRFDLQTRKFSHYSFPDALRSDEVRGMIDNGKGVLWITTNRGLTLLNTKTLQFAQYHSVPGNPRGLRNDDLESIIKDREGIIWIAGREIAKCRPQTTFFNHYFYNPLNNNSLSGNKVWPIVEDKEGIVWVGTIDESGLNRFDRRTNQWMHYKHNPGDPNSLGNNKVWHLVEGRDDKLWMTTGNGLNCLDKKTGKFTHYVHDRNNPKSLGETTNVSQVMEDSKGNLWVGTRGGGLNRMIGRTGKFERFTHHPNDPYSISGDDICSLHEDKTGKIWIGMWKKGLCCYDPLTHRFKRYLPDPANAKCLLNENTYCIEEDRSGKIWIGGPEGVNCLDPKTDEIKQYREKEGLPNRVVYGIEEDRQGRLWMSTNRGIARLDPKTNQFAYFDTSDGLQSLEFNGFSSGKSKKTGELFFGGMNGFNIFQPDSVRESTFRPVVLINSLRRFNLGTSFEEILTGKKDISLSYDDNMLTFEFLSLSLDKPAQNQYAYQLKGFSDQWYQLGTKREVTFAQLASGNYTLLVKGSNGNGIWNETPVQLRITIHPPWWLTWWAYSVYSALLVMGLVMARRIIINRERLRANLRVQQVESDKLRELDTLKSRFFANLSHEFRTPLALISGIVQKLLASDSQSKNQKEDYNLIQRHTHRILQLINQLLDLSRLEAGQLQLHPQLGDVMGLLRSLAGSFESLAQSKGVTYHYALPLHPLWTRFDADKLEKIVTNLLTNAIKFTPKGGQIVWTVSVENTITHYCHLRLIVQDTGIGIAAEHLPHIFDRFYQADPTATRAYEGVGIGLALTKELVALLDGDIRVESKLNEGTTFTLTLPILLVTAPELVSELPHNGKITEPMVEVLPKTSPQISPNRHSLSLLVIEDNTDLRQFICQSLASRYTTLEAADGQAGLEKALKALPDLIISDVMMPGLDGLALCQRLKTDEHTSHIPIILLTAKADVESKLSGLEYGADDYLTKPFQLAELQIRIQNLIKQRQQLRERFSQQITLHPAEVTVTSTDERFLQRALEVVEANMANTDFDVVAFSREMAMSRAQLHRKLTALTNQAPNEFVRLLRLRRAADLLRQRHGNVGEVALAVGFNSLNYFIRSFREQFGKTPSEFTK